MLTRTIALALALLPTAGLAAAKRGAPPDLSGVYMIPWGAGHWGGGPRENPPPLTPAAQVIRDERVASQNSDRPWADAGARCLPPGMPRIALTPPPYPFEVVQTKDKVIFIAEASAGVTRYIHLDRPHLGKDDLEPSYNGDSIGHWEGDTLVVDTIGLVIENHTIEKNGLPIMGELHITERIRRIAPDKIENTVTLEDPKTFTRPWTQKVVWNGQPGVEIREFVCVQNNRTVVDDKGNMAAEAK